RSVVFVRQRRWFSVLLGWLFFVELIVAAAVPLHAARISPARPAGPTPVVVRDRAVRLLGLGGPTTDRLLSRIASNMGAAVDQVEAFWGVDWPRDISVVAAGSDDEFRTAAGGGLASQWADIAA